MGIKKHGHKYYNYHNTVGREIFVVKNFGRRPLPTKIKHAKYFVYSYARMRYAHASAIQIIFRPIPIFVAKSGDEN